MLYIAMTRAQNYLTVSYSGESEFTGYFDRVSEEKEETKKVLRLEMQ